MKAVIHKSILQILLFAGIPSFLIASCYKFKSFEQPQPENGVASATIEYDGRTIDFTGTPDSSHAQTGTLASNHTDYFLLHLRDDKQNMNLEVYIDPFNPQTLAYDVAAGFWGPQIVLPQFFPEGGNAATTHFVYSTILQVANDTDSTLLGSGLIKLTSFTPENVRGTFEMNLVYSNPETDSFDNATITKGSFNLPLKIIDIN